MTSFAPLRTGQFIIKPRSLPRRRAVWVSMIVLLVLVPYVTFEVGRWVSGYSMIASVRKHLSQASRIDELQTQVANLQRELRGAQLGRKVDQQSSDAMQQSFASLQATIQKQREELAFYQAIVSPASKATREPQVQRLEVRHDVIERRYLLRLVLIQSIQALGNAQGKVQVQITGTRHGQSVSLSLQELMVGEGSAGLSFDYRYFQTLEPLIELPTEFAPQSVQVTLYVGQRMVQRQDFVWQPL